MSSSEFQTQIQPQRQGGFPMPFKKGHLLVDKKQTLNIPLSMVEVIHYTLEGVLIQPVTSKIQVSFLTQ
jgi:hypothetical protein